MQASGKRVAYSVERVACITVARNVEAEVAVDQRLVVLATKRASLGSKNTTWSLTPEKTDLPVP